MAIDLVYDPGSLDGVDTLRFRTSERLTYRRCRRLWNWTAGSHGNLVSGEPDYFWFGTGIHFSLEDYHGFNRYEHPARAWLAYCMATAEMGVPYASDDEYRDLGQFMMQYYADYWLRNRPPLKTLWVDGVPQCEVRVVIPLHIYDHLGRMAVYTATLDRVVVDDLGFIWIQEYKSFKAFRVSHLDVDDQVTSYCWAASHLYDAPVQGVVYTQFKKGFPNMPRLLSTGKISTDAKQGTTAILYRDALREQYGPQHRWPSENIIFLNKLIELEQENSDQFIRRDAVYRNEFQIAAQGEKILMEVEEMLRPDLPLYPNPTKDCSWQCPLMDVCLAVDDGSDWEGLLKAVTKVREPEEDEDIWRMILPQPEEIPALKPLRSLPQGALPLPARVQSQSEDKLEWLEV